MEILDFSQNIDNDLHNKIEKIIKARNKIAHCEQNKVSKIHAYPLNAHTYHI